MAEGAGAGSGPAGAGGAAAPDPRAERVRLESGRAAVEIAPGVGGRIAALEVDGWDLVRRDGWTDNEWGIFVMAPWAGRLRGARVTWRGRSWSVPPNEPPHALHGLVSAVPWTVTDRSATEVRMERQFGPAWAPGGRVVHAVALRDARLVLRLEVHADDRPTPAIVGWHPWFRRTATRLPGSASSPAPVALAAEVGLRAGRRVDLDADGLPPGRIVAPRAHPQDDVLLDVIADPVVRWPGGPSLTLRATGAAAWIAYTLHPDGVCVEPVTGIPDGLNGGLLGEPPVAEPGAPLVAILEIGWG